MSGPSPHVTTLLLAWGNGDEHALDELIPLVHRELRRMAQRAMAGEHAGHTLQPTALVNEVYLRLVDIKSVQWNDRAHFFALSARLMRRILVDLARSKRYEKRGGGAPTISLDDAAIPAQERAKDLVALDEALQRLSELDPRRSQVVELRFFGGLGVEETAEVLNVVAAYCHARLDPGAHVVVPRTQVNASEAHAAVIGRSAHRSTPAPTDFLFCDFLTAFPA